LLEPVALVDGNNRKRVVILGVRGWSERSDLVAPFFEALAAKQTGFGLERKEVKPWTVADWAETTAREAVEAMRGRKYLPECYLERRGVDDVVEALAARGGRALLLLGEAGSGKSSLLARLVERLTGAPDHDGRPEACDIVLFLSGRSAFDGDIGRSARELLCDAVLTRAGVRSRAFADLADFCVHLAQTAKEDAAPGRKVWLIFDALNEADRFADLVGAVDAFLPAVGQHSWLRVIVSIRSGAYHALAARHGELARRGSVFANERYLLTFADGKAGERAKEERPYLEIRPFVLETEGQPSYALRQGRLPDRAAQVCYEQLDPQLRTALLSPLHLHLFHETLAGKEEVPSGLDASVLFDAYLDRLGTEWPGLQGTLADIGMLMYEGRTPALAAAVADEWLSAWRARHGFHSAAAVSKLDPIEELVSATVLLRPAEAGVGADRRLVAFQFSHQKLCEQVLVRELRRQIAPRTLSTGDELLAWARHAAGPPGAAGFAELTGALERVAAQLVECGQGDALAPLLDLEDDDIRTAIFGSGLRALGAAWGPTAEGNPAAATALESLARAATPQQRAVSAPSGSAGPALANRDDLADQDHLASSGRAHARSQRLGTLCREAMTWLRRTGLNQAADAIGRMLIQVGRRWVESEPNRGELQHDLAVSLGVAGHGARSARSPQEAWCYYREARDLMRGLVKANPNRADWLFTYAISLTNAGDLLLEVGEIEEAQAALMTALDLMRKLAKCDPHRTDWRRELSMALNNMGRFAAAAGQRGEARGYFEQSLSVARSLVQAEPDRTELQHDLSMVLASLTQWAQAERMWTQARIYAAEDLAVIHRLAETEPHRADLQSDLAVSLGNVGHSAQAAGRVQEAHAYFHRALAISRRLAEADPQAVRLQRELSAALSNMGGVAREAGMAEDARRHLEESLSVMRGVVEVDPSRADLWQDLSAVLGNNGGLARAEGRNAEAAEYFAESLELRRELVRVHPNRVDLLHDLSETLGIMGRMALAEGGPKEAFGYFEDRLSVTRRRLHLEPDRTDLKRQLAEMLLGTATVAWETGRSAEASGHLEESLALTLQLVEVEPDRCDFVAGLARCCWQLHESATEATEKVHYREFVVRALAPLRSACVESAELAELWAWVSGAPADRACDPIDGT
jgi:tetratricopeptide (TPR) repeat protein/GTPase SAR1 family protein